MPQHDALESYRTELAHQRVAAMHGDTEQIRIAAVREIHRLTAKIRELERR
jgi:hypothetical protein